MAVQVGAACAPAASPAAGGAEVVGGWHPGGYPDMYACPESSMLRCTEQRAGTLARKECMVAGEEAFCFAFRTDNTGSPRSAEEVRRGFEVARSQFPGAEVVAGDLDSFYAAAAADETLPVVTQRGTGVSLAKTREIEKSTPVA